MRGSYTGRPEFSTNVKVVCVGSIVINKDSNPVLLQTHLLTKLSKAGHLSSGVADLVCRSATWGAGYQHKDHMLFGYYHFHASFASHVDEHF